MGQILKMSPNRRRHFSKEKFGHFFENFLSFSQNFIIFEQIA